MTSVSASTASTDSGSMRSLGFFGSLVASHGEAMILRSRTASLKTAARMRWTTPTEPGARVLDNRLTRLWDVAGKHRGERPVAEHGVDVQAQHRLEVRSRGRPVDLARPPLFGVVPHRLSARVRVDELSADECCGDLVLHLSDELRHPGRSMGRTR